ncbi:quinolinate synthase NadA [Flammeovirgaceae bacterium SG7u.111]|nr:quinolinate synthase NadA [Flammeovirgaceae bacterium SG7u.132]WPO37766.1 quinolinate synthase NadA [Flammeovirgaceae bacterium SG7u.111]
MSIAIAEKELETKGYLDLPIEQSVDLVAEIERLKKEKNAIILAHFYQDPSIQDIADYLGDSLKLSQIAAENDADIILFAGVYFMAETAKILSPEKKVILPDLNAGCSLADSCPTEPFAKFVADHPNHTVVTYINSNAEIKAMSDIICTSSNAKKIIESIPEDQPILFAPDRNLGQHIIYETGRDMVLWDGACDVHEVFSIERLQKMKEENPDAEVIAHPECQKLVRMFADFIGSTNNLLNYVQKSDSKRFIVLTEAGIIHQMEKAMPNKEFIPGPVNMDNTCSCSECAFMRLNTLQKVYLCLKHEQPEVHIEEELRKKAYAPIKRMLDISK